MRKYICLGGFFIGYAIAAGIGGIKECANYGVICTLGGLLVAFALVDCWMSFIHDH